MRRKTTCLSDGLLASTDCPAITKPSTRQPCNLQSCGVHPSVLANVRLPDGSSIVPQVVRDAQVPGDERTSSAQVPRNDHAQQGLRDGDEGSSDEHSLPEGSRGDSDSEVEGSSFGSNALEDIDPSSGNGPHESPGEGEDGAREWTTNSGDTTADETDGREGSRMFPARDEDVERETELQGNSGQAAVLIVGSFLHIVKFRGPDGICNCVDVIADTKIVCSIDVTSDKLQTNAHKSIYQFELRLFFVSRCSR